MGMTLDATRVTGHIGGQPKKAYYTPDGRTIRAMPDMHDYSFKGENGVRDANLDKGWLLQMPTELKLYCANCTRWHDTEEEISKCGITRSKFIAKHTKKAGKELQTTDNIRLAKLEGDMGEIKGLLTKLLEKE